MVRHYSQRVEEFCVMGKSYIRPELSNLWIPQRRAPDCDPLLLQAARIRWHSEIDIVPISECVEVLVARRYYGGPFMPEKEVNRRYIGVVQSYDYHRDMLGVRVEADFDSITESDSSLCEVQKVIDRYKKIPILFRDYSITSSIPNQDIFNLIQDILNAHVNAEVADITEIFAGNF